MHTEIEFKKLLKYTNQLSTELPIELFPKAEQKIKLQKFANDNVHCLNNTPHYDALVLIDVQKEFCDNTLFRGNIDTENTSKRIASLTPLFRAANLPVYSIYTSYRKMEPDKIDFHHYEFNASDILIRKTHNSAFRGSGDPFAKILKKSKHKNLLVMGFNATACVSETVEDAQDAGLNCTILTDCISNDSGCSSDLSSGYLQQLALSKGLKFAPSSYALNALETFQPPKNTPTTRKHMLWNMFCNLI
jgi:nicotinamidase-related amidase